MDMKEERGITLISLVVTIVVVIILSGVTIMGLRGENGIITKAIEGKELSRKAGIEEKIDLWEIKNEEERTEEKLNLFVESLKKEGEITEEEMNEIKDTHQLIIGKQEPIIFPYSPKIVTKFCDKEECDNPTHIHIGDYVYNYNDYITAKDSVYLKQEKTGIESTQTFEVDKENTQWRVLGVDDTKKHLIITTMDPIRKKGEDPYLRLKGAEGFFYTNDELLNQITKEKNILDEICSLYSGELSNKDGMCRSIRIEDINRILNLRIDKNNYKIYKKNGNEEIEIPTDSFDISFATGKYKKGEYALENYLNSFYPEKGFAEHLKKEGNDIIGAGYRYSYDDSNLTNPNSRIYDVLFKNTIDGKKSYWIASSKLVIDSINNLYGYNGTKVGNGWIRKSNNINVFVWRVWRKLGSGKTYSVLEL